MTVNTAMLQSLTYGLHVCSAMDEGRPVGCIINTAMQVASAPMLFAFSLNRENYTREVLMRSRRFALNILARSAPVELFGIFGFRSGRDTDKFEDVAHILVEGLPVLGRDTCGTLLFDLRQGLELGTHTLVIAELAGTVAGESDTPMSYAYYHRELKGTSPKTAPSYREEAKGSDSAVRAVCQVCGYVHDAPAEELGEDFRCPVCGVDRMRFQNG